MKLDGYQIVCEIASTLDFARAGAIGGGLYGGATSALFYKNIINSLKRKILEETDPERKRMLKKRLNRILKMGRTKYALRGTALGVVGGAIGAPIGYHIGKRLPV